MFTSGFVWFQPPELRSGGQLTVVTNQRVKHLYWGEPERRKKASLLSSLTVLAAENRTAVTPPRHPATSPRLPQHECRRSERPGQLGAEAHRGDPPPAVRRRGAALPGARCHRHRRRGQGRSCPGFIDTGSAVWKQPKGDEERTVNQTHICLATCFRLAPVFIGLIHQISTGHWWKFKWEKHECNVHACIRGLCWVAIELSICCGMKD